MTSALTLKKVVENPTLTATAADIYTNNTTRPVRVRYISERASHLNLFGDATAAHTYVPADTEVLLNIDPGKALSAIRTAAELDGSVWVTEIGRV